MLRAFRSHAKSFISKIILGLLIASFAVWGIGDMVVQRPGQEEAARIGKTVISRLAVEREMQQDVEQIRKRIGEKYRPEILQMLKIPQQVVGRMVAAEVLRQESKALGLIASDEMIAEILRADSTFQNDEGKFDKKIFQYILRQNGLSERDFVARMRDDVARRLIGQTVSGNFGVPDIAVKVMQAAEQEKRDVTVYTIAPKGEDIAEPTDNELDAYYQSVSSRYAIPEYRTASYVTIDEKHVRDELSVSDEELQAIYDERIDEYTLPETRDLELLLYTGKEDALKAKALLEEGKSSEEIAKDMPPINVTNTVIKQATKSRVTEEMRDAVFALNAGDVSEPIASGFGFHVVKVSRINAASTKPFADVKTSLQNEVKSSRASTLLLQKADTLEDTLAGGSTLAEAASELGLTVKKVGPFSRQGKTPKGGNVSLPSLKNFTPIAFNTNEGEDSAVSVGQPGVYFLVHMDKVDAEELPPIANVKDELIKGWKASKRDTAEMQHANEVAAKLADSISRKEVTASEMVKTLASGKLSRTNLELAGVSLPTEMVQSIFAVSVGNATSISKLPNGRYAVAVVKSSALPALAENTDSEATKTVRASIETNQQQELMQQLMLHLNQKYGVVVNQNVIAQIGKDEL